MESESGVRLITNDGKISEKSRQSIQALRFRSSTRLVTGGGGKITNELRELLAGLGDEDAFTTKHSYFSKTRGYTLIGAEEISDDTNK